LESEKAELARLWKQKHHDLQQEINETKTSVRLLEFQLKEKEQELKLCELKIKELKKSMPNSKLKPLRMRTDRTNASQDGASNLNEKSFDVNLPQEN